MTGRGHSRRDVSSWAGGNSESSHGNHVPRYAFDTPTWIKTKEKRLTLRYGFHNSSESMWWTLASERSRADGLYANSPMSKFHPLSIWAMLALENLHHFNSFQSLIVIFFFNSQIVTCRSNCLRYNYGRGRPSIQSCRPSNWKKLHCAA